MQIEELERVQYGLIWLYDKNIELCIACRNCQRDWTIFGCRYGDEKEHSIWIGKKLAIITTCVYKPEKGTDLFEEGIKRINNL